MKRPIKVAGCVGLLAVVACATAAVPPPRFVQTPAYHATASSIVGVLQRDAWAQSADPNAPSHPTQAAVVRRDKSGALALHVLDFNPKATDPAAAWPERCVSEPVLGDELTQLAWVGPVNASWVLLSGSEENPEEVVQSVRLVDPADCRSHFFERLRVPTSEPGTPAPPAVLLSQDGRQLRLFDRLDQLRLLGVDGPTAMPVRCRQRCADFSVVPPSEPDWQTTNLGLLVTTPTEVRWRGADPNNETALPELFDGHDATAFALRPGDAGQLLIRSQAPLVLVELHHGCDAGGPAPLEVGAAGFKDTYRISTPPKSGTFVRAAGRRRSGGPFSEDLLALAAPSDEVALQVSKSDAVRCLREIVGYTFLRFEGLTKGPCR